MINLLQPFTKVEIYKRNCKICPPYCPHKNKKALKVNTIKASIV